MTRNDKGQFKRERTVAEKQASRMIFGDPDYTPRRPDAQYIVGTEWVTYTALVARIGSEQA